MLARKSLLYYAPLLHTFEDTWADLAHWSRLEPDERSKLIHAIERTYEDTVEKLRPLRDKRLAGILRSLERTRRTVAMRYISQE